MNDSSASDEADDGFGKIVDEFSDELRQGRNPSIEQYASRYPEYEEDIRDLLPTLALMERTKPIASSAPRNAVKPLGDLQHSQLGDYRILREVGRGGMGIVYEALQTSLNRRVALKVLTPRGTGRNERERFAREARAAAKLHHTNIVPVFGFGEQDELTFYVMQYIQGAGLDRVLEAFRRAAGQQAPGATGQQGPDAASPHTFVADASTSAIVRVLLIGSTSDSEDALTQPQPTGDAIDLDGIQKRPDEHHDQDGYPSATRPSDDADLSTEPAAHPAASSPDSSHSMQRGTIYWRQVARIGAAAADALHHAHQQGIMHRDIKPSNLVLDLEANVWITDFGLAKSADHENLTETGDIIGTLRYLAPEAFDGSTDTRSDLYSLGLTLYELLTLQPAFPSTDSRVLLKSVATGEPKPIRQLAAEVPVDLATIVEHAIRREPGDRYSTAEEFAEDLKRFLRDEPIHARRESLWQQARRWSRRNRGLAAAMTGILSLLLLMALGATGAAIHYQNLEARQRELRTQADELAARNQRLAYNAEMAVALNTRHEHRGTLRAENLLSQWIPNDGEPDLRGWEWYYIHSLCHRELAALKGHTSVVTAVAFHPQGEMFASASHDGSIRVWDSQVYSCLAELDGQCGQIYGLAWSPDGSMLASAAESGVVVWDGATRQRMESREKLRELPSELEVFAVAFSPDSDLLAVGMRGGPIEIWDTRSWEKKSSLSGHVVDVYTELISFNDDGTALAAPAGRDVKIFDLAGGQEQRSWTTTQGFLQASVYDPHGRKLATSGRGAQIKIWDLDLPEDQEPLMLIGHTHGVAAMAWHPTTNRMASAGWDGSCRIWDLDTATEIGIPRGHDRHVFSVAWHPSGQWLVSGGDDHLVKVWPSDEPDEPRTIWRADGQIKSFALSRGNEHLVTGTLEGIATVRSLLDNTVLCQTQHEGQIIDIAISPDLTRFACAMTKRGVAVHRLDSGDVEAELESVNQASSVQWSHDGRLIATTHRTNAIEIWDGETYERTASLGDGSTKYRLARFSPNGSRLLVAGTNGEAQIWDLDNGTFQSLDSRDQHVLCLTWSDDAKRIALGTGERHVVRVFDASNASLIHELAGHSEVINAVDFSPDGKRILSGDSRCTLKLWDSDTGTEIITLRGPIGSLDAAQWNAEGTTILCNSNSRVVAWDASPGYAVEPPQGRD